ncbi:hypothetical protein M3Y98_00714700 [Aphelenchoides besseyi]|nr:hypothetical protein M3Y98_00714700 [Aphelenchoides besseyi]
MYYAHCRTLTFSTSSSTYKRLNGSWKERLQCCKDPSMAVSLPRGFNLVVPDENVIFGLGFQDSSGHVGVVEQLYQHKRIDHFIFRPIGYFGRIPGPIFPSSLMLLDGHSSGTSGRCTTNWLDLVSYWITVLFLDFCGVFAMTPRRRSLYMVMITVTELKFHRIVIVLSTTIKRSVMLKRRTCNILAPMARTHDGIPIGEGDFEKYYEIWYKPNHGTYLVCSTYLEAPVYALNYPGTNNGGHLIVTHTPKYLIQYEQHGSQDPNDRYVKNWPSDVPLKSFMINNSLLINSTHLMYTNDILRLNPGNNNPKCCPLKKIEAAIPDLTFDMKNKIEECFRMDGNQPLQPYCVLKTDDYGNSIWDIVNHDYPVLYHKHDVTVFYKPTNEMNYFVPKNLTTFPSEPYVTDEIVVVLFGVLISSLFVLAEYVKNETSVDVHASKRLLQEGPGLSVIKCLCYESNCSGGLQNCPFYSCYQMFSSLGALLHRGCYVAMEQEGWVQRGRILWHFCNMDIELGDTIWSHSPKTVVAPTVLPAIELARTDLNECLEGVVADMEQEYTGPECVNWPLVICIRICLVQVFERANLCNADIVLLDTNEPLCFSISKSMFYAYCQRSFKSSNSMTYKCLNDTWKERLQCCKKAL